MLYVKLFGDFERFTEISMRFQAKKCSIRSSFAVLRILLFSVLRTLRIVHSESVTLALRFVTDTSLTPTCSQRQLGKKRRFAPQLKSCCINKSCYEQNLY